ncbi:putative serine protease F56F10.1 [Agrilus planipennis]|uniref:Serine protease F56F10.1 n=1 Tax=Agrilus planipennis TaxID=224129 RepID=A0A7F5RGP2_AGRPL|nr:putative serine protease F56F10.1 [Agrilus planipennis]
MNCQIVLVFFVTIWNFSNSWRIFHRGRSVGGNIGQPPETSAPNVPEKWFIQNLDHFNPSDTRTWRQRYFVNDSFFESNGDGPVFLMIGGEGEASKEWMTQGAWIAYAQAFGALCFQLEHRYYGKSHPTEDLGTSNLLYLTSQQALADLANFITSMNDHYNLTSKNKWIAFGGSYPGSLAAWLRLKYPHLVKGAMSASGPLLAKVDFQEYFQVVDDSLATYSDQCVRAVKEGTYEVNTLLRHRIGQLNVNNKFKLCDPVEKSIDNKNDISNLFETLAGNFAGVVQYNKDNRLSKNKTGPNITIDTVCAIMVNDSVGPPVDRLAAVNELILRTSNQSCLDYKYDKMVQQMRNVSWDSEVSEGGRQWTYQTCTEFGFFQSSSYRPQIFGDQFPVDFFIQQCVDIFGPEYKSSFLNYAVNRTNMLYGALDIDVTNVVFVHGSIDPWHALGITETKKKAAPAIYIKGTAHCANMYPPSKNDLPQLAAARRQIYHYIESFIYSNN